MVPFLKMRRFSCLLRLLLPLEMGEMAQTLMSEIEWLDGPVTRCNFSCNLSRNDDLCGVAVAR